MRCKQPIVQMVVANNVVWAVDRRQPHVFSICPRRHCVLGIVDCRSTVDGSPGTSLLVRPTATGQPSPQSVHHSKPPDTQYRLRSQTAFDEAVPTQGRSRLSSVHADPRAHPFLPQKGKSLPATVLLSSGTASEATHERNGRPPCGAEKIGRDQAKEGESIVMEGTRNYLEERCTDLCVADGNLWVSQCNGDILIIDPNINTRCPRLARLKTPLSFTSLRPSTRSKHRLLVCGGDKYVASHLNSEFDEDKSLSRHQCTLWAVCSTHLLQQHSQHCSFLCHL